MIKSILFCPLGGEAVARLSRSWQGRAGPAVIAWGAAWLP